jgi:hypothetical protein
MIPIREKKEIMLFNRIPVMIQDKPNYDVEEITASLQKTIPVSLVRELDYVIVGDSEYLNERDLDSVYLDGVIYMSPEIEDTEEALLTMVHEVAHSVEENFPQIYADETIETEFIGKRIKLMQILKSQDIETTGHDFVSTEYDEKFDDFLYLQVGYPRLRTLTSGLFMSPYATTSVREYFADAFEEYFLRDPMGVKLMAPAVYYKIEELLEALGERFI